MLVLPKYYATPTLPLSSSAMIVLVAEDVLLSKQSPLIELLSSSSTRAQVVPTGHAVSAEGINYYNEC
jgi:hypothetical protein